MIAAPKAPKTRTQSFIESPDKIHWLRDVLSHPIGQEVMAILDEAAEPHDTTLSAIVKEQGQNATTAIALIHAAQAGQRRVIRTLKALASPKPEQAKSIMEKPLFEHIDETYFDQNKQ